MVVTGGQGAQVRPIEQRLAEAMRMPPLVVWLAVTLVALVLCIVWHNATGAWRGLDVGGEPFWRTAWRLEIVFAVILGYLVACGRWIVRSVRRDLDALAPVLALEPAELAAERDTIGLFSRAALLGAVAGGVTVGVAINAVVNSLLPPGHPAWDDLYWRLLRDVTIWIFAIRLMLVVIGSARRVSRLSERAARIDLLDLRGLAPLARIGLRSALAFAVAASMIAALAGDALTLPVTLVTMAVVAVVGAFTVLLPVRGARRAIRAAKDAELLAIRAAIAHTRNATLNRATENGEDAGRLGGLLALEQRIVSVGEWPFGIGTFLRFALFIVLPLGSWIAAALVERMVSRVLG